MSEHLEDWTERPAIDWAGAFQRLFLIMVLLSIAVLLVVGTQNYDERARVHFLIWSKEVRLVSFFLLSVGVGILVVFVGYALLCLGVYLALPVIMMATTVAYRKVFPRSEQAINFAPPPPNAYPGL